MEIFLGLLDACNWVWCISYVIWAWSVKGSYRRYMLANIQWVVIWPGLLDTIFDAVSRPMSPLTAFNMMGAVFITWHFLTSKDDNWWGKQRKRLGKALRNALSTQSPVLAPAGGRA